MNQTYNICVLLTWQVVFECLVWKRHLLVLCESSKNFSLFSILTFDIYNLLTYSV